ncbi:MAG: hypothetical protein J0J05_07095 [Microbacterium sp.]|nr:hypothetical protein [Microbacterium sp.]MBN9153731.1 hypothetical protein [Microbacterium sp.]
MDAITAGALSVTLTAVSLYVLYWVVRKAVAAGIRDARADSTDEPEG